MKRYFFMILSLVTVLVVSGVAGALQVAEVDRPDIQGFVGFVADEIVVRFAPGILKRLNKATAAHGRLGIPDLDQVGAEHGVLSIKPQFPGARKKMYQGRELDLSGWYQVKFRGEVDAMAVVKAYKARPGVLDAQPIGIHTVSQCPNDEGFDISGNSQGVDQWHLKKIQACDAFNFETGNESIIVAIADTGVRYFHKDLGGAGAFYKANADPNQNPFTPEERALLDGNVWFNLAEKTGSNIVDDDGNGKINDWVGWDFVGEASTFPYAPYPGEDGSVEDNDPRDFNGHGTHCAGIVAAMTNNDRDLASVAGGWGSGSADDTHGNGVKIMPLRIGWSAAYFGFMEVGLVRMDYAARALSYAADKGAKIVSCSWGSSNSGGLGAAVDYFLASGGLIFKAAGNSNNQTADYLCSRSDVISVAATDQNDAKASFSSYGAWVDISAPGVNIWSLYHGHGPLLDPAVDYVESLSGTSMATPMAAGVAALIWSKNPGWPAEQVKQRLFATADDIDALNPTYAGKLGAGRVNASAAVREDSPVPTNYPPTASFIYNATGLTVAFDGSGSDDPNGKADIKSYDWSFGDGANGSGVTVQHSYSAGGTYTVTLTVTDNGGLNDTYQQNITVSQEPAATTMHVGGLQGSSAPLNKRFWQARVVVTIQDAQGQPVPNATVYGTFIDVRNGATTGVTDSNGQVALTQNISNKQSSTTFRVDDVTHAALSYDPSGNIGSQITIPKP